MHPTSSTSLRALATPAAAVPTRARPVPAAADSSAERVLDSLRGAKITVVGQHPDGFDTCEYDEDLLFNLAGLRVETVQLGRLFDKARAMDAARVGAARAGAAQELEGLDDVDQQQLDRSFRVFCALEDVQRESRREGPRRALLARDVHRVRLRGLRPDGDDEPEAGARRL